MTSRAARAIGILAMVLLAAAACRSDGGVGRRDALRGMRWTLDSLERQHATDVKRTAQNVEGLADWCSDEVSHPTRDMRRTMALYLEGNADR